MFSVSSHKYSKRKSYTDLRLVVIFLLSYQLLSILMIMSYVVFPNIFQCKYDDL